MIFGSSKALSAFPNLLTIKGKFFTKTYIRLFMTSPPSPCLPLLFLLSTPLYHTVTQLCAPVVLTAGHPSLYTAVSLSFCWCYALCLKFCVSPCKSQQYALLALFVSNSHSSLVASPPLSVSIFLFTNLITSLNYVCSFPQSFIPCPNNFRRGRDLCLSHFCSFSSDIVFGIHIPNNCLPNSQITLLSLNTFEHRNNKYHLIDMCNLRVLLTWY